MGRSFRFVILGGGVSAGYAALEFVRLGIPAGDLCIITDEAVAPYERPALSKGFLLPEGAVRLPAFHTCVGVGAERLTARWYKEHGIELLLNTQVVSVDLKRQTLLTSAKETIAYLMLIVATGARVLRLEEFGVTGADARNIFYLRNLHDATKLVEAMQSCSGGKAVVIGGGYIGMECAAALVSNGVHVTMVFPESHCIARLFTPQIATFYEDYYTRKGVVFVKGTVMSTFESDKDGKVAAVVLKDGTRLPADLVVVGVGIRPNTTLLEGQLIMEKGGIKVNGKMRTSNSTVYAVGDVAAFPLKMYGDVRRLEHVDHARKSAAHAVESIMHPERAKDYDYLPYFYSRVFSLSWQFFGDNSGECLLFGDLKSEKFGAYWVDRGRLVGAFLEGGSKSEYAALAVVARKRPMVEDVQLLAGQGIKFALALCEATSSDSLVSTMAATDDERGAMAAVASDLLQHSGFKVGAGIVVAVAVSWVAYWYGRKKWRK
ncbi:hypothetical protein SELMODRAFT_131995 [Selaginella moellendorffii]|uniref:monodehydroascorbate reductase (NADH) n=1 Tax=Selaginella moellendorffii TaxID=88036 RepID=D8T4X1_SELML|nr:monodehydroascorbate reductase 2, peroxisomal [Selaginella moellendorffii]EFJ08252.1 hypothetical protein SELMODRAFT_131995 [Selaginella moellendorffii]|eukprot:XP_002990620.1 monodehydroascorbate reductase 2, peroxisomal [Selaginella moellendorffii]